MVLTGCTIYIMVSCTILGAEFDVLRLPLQRNEMEITQTSGIAGPSKEYVHGKECAADLLVKMIENGPREFLFNRKQLQSVLRMAADVFLDECSLLEIPLPCMVYGDTHGQYSDLLRWFNLNGWPHETRCVFLGDFVDRGSHGVELFALLACLKVGSGDK
ncbi:hypothetical protein OSTOST_17029 [Ostertagia ostertagi]